MGLVLLFYGQQAAAGTHSGAASLALTFGATTDARVPSGAVSLPITFGRTTSWQYTQPDYRVQPDVTFAVAFDSEPLSSTPAWVELADRLEGSDTSLSTTRGRSYEFDRMETGTLGARLENRDSALNPENTASPYHPVRSTRPVRAYLGWDQPYPLFRGISEGFPQSYPHFGKNALVELRASDLFYALNNARFTPGSTALVGAMAGGVAQNTVETISVEGTALPMPQAPPFDITVGSDLTAETMTVTEILSATQYRVTRTAETTYAHSAGQAVSTLAVSFGEEMSGRRILNVIALVLFSEDALNAAFNSTFWDLDEGQSLIAPSEDLANTNPLDHINLIADAEFGRFFVSREGKYTFRDRQSVYVDHLTPDVTFTDERPASGTQVPFVLDAPLEHSEEKLYNRVRITIQGGDYDGQVVDLSDETSITDHFERIFERTFPYANPNDAEAAARFVLARSAEDTLRLPALSVAGAREPDRLWPLLLAREIGDRCHFRYQPEGGGDLIEMDVVIDGISHSIAPGDHRVVFQCTEVDSTQYWILGRAGYSELGATTRVGF